MVIRVSMRERGDFGEVAKRHGVSVAELLRRYVRRELDAAKAQGQAAAR